VSCAKTAKLIDNHVVWNAESGRSRERVLYEDVDAAEEGTFGGVWPIEKHCKASDFGH